MRGIAADHDVIGPLHVLVRHWRTPYWSEIWESLRLRVMTFDELGLNESASDDLVWHACQTHETVLVTGNRNDSDETSLEATLRQFNASTHLPVFTLSQPQLVGVQRDYTVRVAEGLLQYLFEIDRVRGAGRIWLP